MDGAAGDHDRVVRVGVGGGRVGVGVGVEEAEHLVVAGREQRVDDIGAIGSGANIDGVKLEAGNGLSAGVGAYDGNVGLAVDGAVDGAEE